MGCQLAGPPCGPGPNPPSRWGHTRRVPAAALTPKRWPRAREKPTGRAAEPGRPSWRSSKLAKTQRTNWAVRSSSTTVPWPGPTPGCSCAGRGLSTLPAANRQPAPHRGGPPFPQHPKHPTALAVTPPSQSPAPPYRKHLLDTPYCPTPPQNPKHLLDPLTHHQPLPAPQHPKPSLHLAISCYSPMVPQTPKYLLELQLPPLPCPTVPQPHKHPKHPRPPLPPLTALRPRVPRTGAGVTP